MKECKKGDEFMKRNKNAFTLIELLASVAILSLLIILVAPKLMSNYDNRKEKLYDSTIKELERFTQMYLTDNTNLYDDISKNGYVDVNIDTLCNEELVSCPLKDARDNSNIYGYVRISYENDEYVYKFVRTE